MLNQATGLGSPVLSVLVFIAVVLLLEGLYLMWTTYKGPQAKKI
jgi:tight adherence protein B